MKAIYKGFLCLHGGISPSWYRVSWQNKSTHQEMQCVFSSLFRPITKLMWIPACNETNLQADTQWKGKGIRETTLLINGFKLKTTKSSSCRPAVCFNDCGMGPDVGLSSFSLSNVLSKFIVNYRGLLQGYISLGRAIPRHQPLKHIVAWQQVNQCRDDLQTSSLWYQLMSHYTDNSCANFEEAPGRAHKRIRYVCLTMSLHWFRLWLGAACTTHYWLNKWWHKPTMYVCVTWP